jgi:hypothetical protein
MTPEELLGFRLLELIEFLAVDGGSAEAPAAHAAFLELVPILESKRPSPERAISMWVGHVVDGYVRGHAVAVDLNSSLLLEMRPRLERELKSVAADLLIRGADVSGLDDDSIPLIAYALLHARLPLGFGFDADAIQDTTNDALLSQAAAVREMSEAQRETFLALFRVAFVTGVAQRYGEALNFTKLVVQ